MYSLELVKSQSLCLLFFIFSPNCSPYKFWKMYFIHIKCCFRPQDIQVFVFLSSPLFFSVGHYFREWMKINLKVFAVMNCLNKNLVTHFVWYLEKGKRYGIETLSTERVFNLIWKIWLEKLFRKRAPKGSPRPPFDFGEPLHQQILLRSIFKKP